jgi:hypothetical protein|tara:strand:+ start:107 stop:271 length:165 start_codon:yes stop_codon:yes gene_type:complete
VEDLVQLLTEELVVMGDQVEVEQEVHHLVVLVIHHPQTHLKEIMEVQVHLQVVK